MRTSTFHAWDRAVGGKLGDLLLGYRSDGLSPEEIAYELRAGHDIKVSRSTVARWLAIAEEEAAA